MLVYIIEIVMRIARLTLFCMLCAHVHIAICTSLRLENISPCVVSNDVTWSDNNSVLYNTAYAWTHHHALKNWQYDILSHNSKRSCARVIYTAPVAVPSFISDYFMHNFLQADVHKRVCVEHKTLTEWVRIDGIPFTQVQLNLHAKIDSKLQHIKYESVVNFEIPWILTPMESAIAQHVKKSVHEYMAILSDNVCGTTKK
jgi:hypothetical protein